MFDRRPVSFALALAGAFVLATGHAPTLAQENVGSSVSAVVYGVDDRLDWYQIPEPAMQSLGRDSIVALVNDRALDLAAPGLLHPPLSDATPSLSEAILGYYGMPLCSGERFAAQPTAALCSGTLVDDDLVITAGHCARTLAECKSVKFVFDYFEIADGVLETIDANDVYSCGRILVREEQASPHIDFAVIQLDRPVVGRVPVPVGPTQAQVPVATPLRVLGFGSGLPMKYDAGGSVISPSSSALDSFITNTDTFGGNSGSGVFTTDGTLVGILVSGQEDYVAGAACTSVNTLLESQAGEQCTYAFRATDALCAGGFPSSLCPSNPAPTCGDHFCSGGEDPLTCSIDCVAPHCADGTCSPSIGEDWTTCPYDCTAATYRRPKGRCTVSMPGTHADGTASGAATWLLALSLLGLRRRR